MKVLHVIPSLASCRGGASKAAIEMVRALRQIGVDAEIACTNDNGESALNIWTGSRITYEGVPVYFFKKSIFSFKPLNEFSYSKSFKQWIKANIGNYDLIHVHALFSFTSSYTMRLARKNNIKYISHPIGSLQPWSLQQSPIRKKIFLSLFDKSNLVNANRVHFTANIEAEQARSISKKITPLVIPLGIDTEKDLLSLKKQKLLARKIIQEDYNLTPSTTTLLFLGRLHTKKGIEKVLRAIRNLDIDLHFLIAGDGDNQYREKLLSLTIELGVEQKCSFLGQVAGLQKKQLLQGCDAFILTSYGENFGIAVVESLAHATPVIVTDEVALSEQVKGFKLGYTCSLEQQEINNTIHTALSSPKLVNYGENGYHYVTSHHDWGVIAKKLETSYKQIIREK